VLLVLSGAGQGALQEGKRGQDSITPSQGPRIRISRTKDQDLLGPRIRIF